MNRPARAAAGIAAVAALTFAAIAFPRAQQPPEGATSLVNAAAEALGGRERILALKTLTMIGYGEMIDGFGLSNIAADRYAPERLNNLLEMERTFDVANERMRVRERRRTNFTFANAGANEGLNRVNQVIDGQVAYNVGANGAANRVGGNAVIERRLRFFTHPVTAVRTALKAGTRLGAIRREGNVAVIGVTTAEGDEFDLGIDTMTSLPSWVRWLIPQQNFGEVTYTTHFTAYMPVDGVQLPIGFMTVQDFRNLTQERLYIDRNIVDGPIDDMTAPASVRTGAAPVGRGGGPPPAPVQLADGVWRLGGSTVFEFDDHMVMFEVNGSEAAVLARIDQAGSLVPGKPLTHAILSHHHDDHASGLRAAVSRGLTLMSHYSNEETFRELTERRTTKYHDALSRNFRRMTFVPVRDHLELKDSRMEVDIYHVINNNHMASGLMAHVPAHRLLVEADLTTPNWDYQWWGGSLLDNIEHRKITVERVSPVHGVVAPLADLVAQIERQVQGAKALCERASAAQLFRPGCPVQYTREPRVP
jgi:hypothetical protein